MLQAGEKRELTVVKETNFGVYLAEEEHSKDKVLLPKKEADLQRRAPAGFCG